MGLVQRLPYNANVAAIAAATNLTEAATDLTIVPGQPSAVQLPVEMLIGFTM
jgi:hypothetical protein